MSPELKSLFISLKSSAEGVHVLPRIVNLPRGDQSNILKMFLAGISLRKIKLHALRACLTIQLLARSAPPAIVIKICGWRHLKTMKFYIRVAGVDEKGATDFLTTLHFEAQVMENVVVELPHKNGQPS